MNFVLSGVEHGKSCITSGLGFLATRLPVFVIYGSHNEKKYSFVLAESSALHVLECPVIDELCKSQVF